MFVVSSDDEVNASKTKIERLREILKNFENKKIVLFSAYDETFIEVKRVLNSMNVKHASLYGTSSYVASIAKRYRDPDGDISVLLANAGNFGHGFNLEVTTDLVVMHKLDDDILRQAIGRAQRPGRVAQLNVWYLLNENEGP
jgi:SNF2 family DNA or RNA helicase